MMNAVIMWLFCKYLFVCCFCVCVFWRCFYLVQTLSLSLSAPFSHSRFFYIHKYKKLSFYFWTWMKWNWFLCMDLSPLIYINMRMWFFHEIILVWIQFFVQKKIQIKWTKETEKEKNEGWSETNGEWKKKERKGVRERERKLMKFFIYLQRLPI